MRLLVVTAGVPTLDPTVGDGTSLIAAQLIPELASHGVSIRLVYFVDRDCPVPPDVEAACEQVMPLQLGAHHPLRNFARGIPGSVARRRTMSAQSTVSGLSGWADLVYLHGFAALALAGSIKRPAVGNLVDPLSAHLGQLARTTNGLQHVGALYRARSAQRYEDAVLPRLACTVVMTEEDAAEVTGRTGARVVAIPNGVPRIARNARSDTRPTIGFVGSLDYPPNIDAVDRLINTVWPVVRGGVDDARLLVAGRNPSAALRAQVEDVGELLANFEDVGAVLSEIDVAVFPGTLGRGIRNSVLEALSAGCVAVSSGRGGRGVDTVAAEHPRWLHVPEDRLPEAARDALTDVGAAAPTGPDLRDWATCAADYLDVFGAVLEEVSRV